MTDRLTITLAQLNPVVGAINGNIDKVREARRQAASVGADLVVCSELVVSGYPPEDLVLKPFSSRKSKMRCGPSRKRPPMAALPSY